jgi:CheY-like chemotaxis protein
MASGKLRIEIEPTDVRLAVEGAVQALRPAAEARGITLEVKLDENMEGILADGERLQQIVWNLLSNAVKFTPRGGSVVLTTQRLPETVVITVRDNGQGISRDFLGHIFEPFRQQEGGTTRRHGGLGLGLAIVQRLVHAHGGTIKAESAGEGSGATFTVELPSRPALPASRRSRIDTPRPAAGPRLDGLTVLVVDDDVDARELLAKVLGDQGAVVLSASSAPAALKVLEELRPDVVLSDVAMPEMDGYGLMRKMRRLPASRGGRTRSIALTAYARPEDAEQALSSGFDAYMSKPVHPGRLVTTIAELARSEDEKHDNVAVLRPAAGRGDRTRR